MFRKKPSRADAAIAVMPEAIDFAADRWLYFCEQIIYKVDVPLMDRIAGFAVPAQQGIENNFPPLRNAPDGLLLMIIAMGVWKSGTHTREEIEAALGAQLPDLP